MSCVVDCKESQECELNSVSSATPFQVDKVE